MALLIRLTALLIRLTSLMRMSRKNWSLLKPGIHCGNVLAVLLCSSVDQFALLDRPWRLRNPYSNHKQMWVKPFWLKKWDESGLNCKKTLHIKRQTRR